MTVIGATEHDRSEFGHAEALGGTGDAPGANPIMNLLSELDTESGALSPEMLIALAQQKLTSIDASIGDMLRSMNGGSDRISLLHAALERMNSFRSDNHSTEPNATAMYESRDGHMVPKADAQILDLDSTAPADMVSITLSDGQTHTFTMREALEQAGLDLHSFDSHVAGHPLAFTPTSLSGIVDSIQARVTDINSQSESVQLKMQQLVSSRGQFSQMISQVLAAMHDTDKAILQNTRA